MSPLPDPPNEGRTCKVNGCERPAHSRGWCPTHYQRWRKYGDPLGNVRPDWRHWTPEEDRQIIAALPADRGKVEYGTSTYLALILERTPGAVWNRMSKLRRRIWEAEKAAALGR